MNIPELLAPVGDFECLKAAVQNGADCIYLGASTFSARASATNFDLAELEEAIKYAKLRNIKVNLALNTLIKQNELEEALNLATKAYELGVDAIIVQDLGLAKTLIKTFPDLPIHASTQITAHNLEGAKELEKMGFKRIVLSRELSLKEIENICNNTNVEIEVFIHGALCVSYSGQCLLSSMIGGRSGNRGKCAGPCRLPYELTDETNEILDKGYILSPKDLSSIQYIPDLIEAGVKCFKIEGRMKTPEYVATVTRIYRKYIDKVIEEKIYMNLGQNIEKRNNIELEDNIEKNTKIEIKDIDKEDLLQVFNRGGFTTGYLEDKNNTNLIFKEKPNNMGIYLGKIGKFNPEKGYIDLILENEVAIGDKISIDNNGATNNYNVSELLINEKNSPYGSKGKRITLGRMKGNIKIGDKVYRIESKELNELALKSYQNVENKRQNIDAQINIKLNEPITMKIYINDSKNKIFNNIVEEVKTEIIPETAKTAPITEERIKEQFSKTKNTIYDFENIKIDMNDQVFLTIGSINELKRIAIETINDIAVNKIKRIKNIGKTIKIDEPVNNKQENTLNAEKIKIAVLLNILNKEYNYTDLEGIDKIYIPLKYFVNPSYKEIIKNISEKYNTYIYLPTIMKKNYTNLLNLQLNNILTNFKIKGIVISNIGQLNILRMSEVSDLEIIANYTFNIYNNETIKELQKIGIEKLTVSPELDKEAILQLNKNALELIVYGNIPVMNSNYCVIGKNTNCNNTGTNDRNKPCNTCNASNIEDTNHTNKKYYIKDRLNLKFRVISDKIDTISTIYNSKTTSIMWQEINPQTLRIDILDENPSEINHIIKKVIKNEKLEGENYTNGNLNRVI